MDFDDWIEDFKENNPKLYKRNERLIEEHMDLFEKFFYGGQSTSMPISSCPECGTTEMLCGYNGPGCLSNSKGD